jgi:acyl CoA:acetate/3-ketoacid CoA transferase alpha subunit
MTMARGGKITEAEWAAEVRRLADEARQPEGWVTAEQVAAASGLPIGAVRSMLGRAVEKGIGKARRCIDGGVVKMCYEKGTVLLVLKKRAEGAL